MARKYTDSEVLDMITAELQTQVMFFNKEIKRIKKIENSNSFLQPQLAIEQARKEQAEQAIIRINELKGHKKFRGQVE